MSRSVDIYFWNNVSQALTLQNSSTGGAWATNPPTNIPATTNGDYRSNPYRWGTDSVGSGENASGSVSYTIGTSSQTLNISWTSLGGKVNGYSISGPATYQFIGGGTDGSAATASFSINPFVANNAGDDEDEGDDEGE